MAVCGEPASPPSSLPASSAACGRLLWSPNRSDVHTCRITAGDVPWFQLECRRVDLKCMEEPASSTVLSFSVSTVTAPSRM